MAAWEIEYTDEFGEWWDRLDPDEQESVTGYIDMVEEEGPELKRPYADAIHGSRFINMRELRVQHKGRPHRVLYAFGPRRTGVLLIGGDKTGNARWYEELVPRADAIYAQHLREIGMKQEAIMARKFSELRDKMDPERRERAAAWAKAELAKLPLQQLRSAREMTQTRLAELLEMDQGNVSKLEQRTDMYLSTLRSYVEALGGELEIRAVFPEGDVKIDLLNKLSAQEKEPAA